MASLDRIISCQEEQADVMDSSLMNFHTRMKELAVSKEEAMKKIVADSVLAKLPKLSDKELQNIKKCVETAVVVSVLEDMHENALSDYESLILSNRWNQIQSDTKAMLELEMSKIQNEHETLGIWAGILTIVFLIFSFYSLFKTDDMVKQGREGLDKLNQLKRDADNKLDELRQRGDSGIAQFEEDSQKVINSANSRLDGKFNEVDDRFRRFQRMFKFNMEQRLNEIGQDVTVKQEEINRLYENAQDQINDIEQKKNMMMHELTMLEARLNMLEQKYDSIKLEMKASEKEEIL